MKCGDVRENLELYAADALEPQVQDGVSEHLDDCELCRSALSDVRLAMDALEADFYAIAPREDLMTSILDRIDREGSCITEEDRILYSFGELDDAGLSRVESHVKTCDTCAAQIGSTTLMAKEVSVAMQHIAPSPFLARRIQNAVAPKRKRVALRVAAALLMLSVAGLLGWWAQHEGAPEPSPTPPIAKTSEPDVKPFARIFGGPQRELFRDIEETGDGTLLIAGFTQSETVGGAIDSLLLEIDADGKVRRQRAFGTPGLEAWFALEPDGKGGWIAAGSSDHMSIGGRNIWVVRLDQNLNVTWQRIFPSNTDDEACDIELTRDGGFVLTARVAQIFKHRSGQLVNTEAPDRLEGMFGQYVIKFAESGDIEWQRVFDVSVREPGPGVFVPMPRVIELASGDVILVSRNEIDGAGNGDVWIVKLRPDGSVAWSRTFGSERSESPYGLRQLSDGTLMIVGYSMAEMFSLADPIVIQIDTDGQVLWEKRFSSGTYGMFTDVVERDGVLFLCGRLGSDRTAGMDAWMVKLDRDRQVEWSKSFGADGADVDAAAVLFEDYIYMVGISSPPGTDISDGMILRIGLDGSNPAFRADVALSVVESTGTLRDVPSTGAKSSAPSGSYESESLDLDLPSGALLDR